MFDWAVSNNARLVVGDVGDRALVQSLVAKHGITEIVHFAARILVRNRSEIRCVIILETP